MIFKIGMLALAGAFGTLARYGLSGAVHRICGPGFPWGTAAVNLIGCLLAGFFWTLFENRWAGSGSARVFVLIGFMGAFTTFSTMILETSHLMRASEWANALGNMALQNILGLAALFVGILVGRWI